MKGDRNVIKQTKEYKNENFSNECTHKLLEYIRAWHLSFSSEDGKRLISICIFNFEQIM